MCCWRVREEAERGNSFLSAQVPSRFPLQNLFIHHNPFSKAQDYEKREGGTTRSPCMGFGCWAPQVVHHHMGLVQSGCVTPDTLPKSCSMCINWSPYRIFLKQFHLCSPSPGSPASPALGGKAAPSSVPTCSIYSITEWITSTQIPVTPERSQLNARLCNFTIPFPLGSYVIFMLFP